ncbi:MAG: hypothetical protein IKB93_04935, partial [Clostridia bacterium]|nr:hypothetical protein [Clostridia bacterium]
VNCFPAVGAPSGTEMRSIWVDKQGRRRAAVSLKAIAETDSSFAEACFHLAGTLNGKTIHRIVFLRSN